MGSGNMSMIEDQKDFMTKGGQTVSKFNFEQIGLYAGLIEEEFNEFVEARSLHDTCRTINDEPALLAHAVKENIDVIVTCLGWLLSTGIEPIEAWNLVAENNLAKVAERVTYDENGKIQKSPESKARKVEMMKSLNQLIIEAQIKGDL